MKDKTKYYFTGGKGCQTIKTTPDKHPIIWKFIKKNWEEIVENYKKAVKKSEIKIKEHKFNILFSSQIPKIKFDEENWNMLENELKIKGGEKFGLGINNPNSNIVYFVLSKK